MDDAKTRDDSEVYRDQRRAALALGVAAVVSTVAASKATAAPGKPLDAHASLDIRAPRDGYVSTVSDKDSVTPGDLVIELDPAIEKDALARIDLAMKLLSDQEQNLSGDALDWQKEQMTQNLNIAQEYEHHSELMLKSQQLRDQTGTPERNGDAYREAYVIRARAQAEVAKCKAASNLFGFQVDQAKRQLQQAKDALTARRDVIASQIEQQTKLKAPSAGRLKLLCYAGAYVQRGQVVATVST
jgi:multidrug resistance efflux pump